MLIDELLTNSLTAAQLLLGWKLSYATAEGTCAGYIVETEAYSMDDPASHSYRGHTARTAPMFQKAGTIYVYLTYGMHRCLNIVTGPVGRGEAVLIRALEPLEGVELMQKRRGSPRLDALMSGPAKLTQALGITSTGLSGQTLGGELQIALGFVPQEITQTTRIGITKATEAPWRFYITDNKYISRP